jgi:outer membrane lipoprotein
MKLRNFQLPVLFLSLLTIFLAWAGGCAYPISRDLTKVVPKDLTYPRVIQNLKEYLGSTVIWGGIISDLRNGKEGAEITVLEAPLDRRGVPDPRITRGTFIARTEEYLDPKVYERGKKITLAGDIIGQETKALDDQKFMYPVVLILELRLWKEGSFESLEKSETQEYKRWRKLGVPPLLPYAGPEEKENQTW